MENEDIVLSICISTYNRSGRVERIVKHLLKDKSNKFNIIVVDDSSTDNTIESLKKICDKRLIVYKNKSNLGAKLNWYETLNKGNGKYLLHFLDRDWANNNYIDKILSILENNDIGFGYIGNYFSLNKNEKSKNAIAVYEKGEEALCEFACMLVHPTGFLVKKECWKNIKNKKRFFENDEYGIYPHSYIFALLANSEQAIAIRYNMFTISSFSNMGRNLSHFYQKKKISYWWTPEAHEYELCAAIKFISDYIETDLNVKQEILLNRFKENIFCATLQYKNQAMDIENVRHYGVPIKYVSLEELKSINYEYKEKFVWNVKKYSAGIYNNNFINAVDEIVEENNKAIYNDTDLWSKETLIAKYKEYYFLMDAWVELYQEGIHLYTFLIRQGIENVAIYGNGKFGKRLREELRESPINTKYIIDKKADRIIEDIPVLLISNELPKVDAIIVTIPDQYNMIYEELSKVCSYAILSLEDLIYSSFEY